MLVSQHLCPGTRIESPAGLDAPLARVKVKMNLPEAEEHSQWVWRSGYAFDGLVPKSKSDFACSLAYLPRATDQPRWNSGPRDAKILLPFERPPLEKLGIRPVSP